MTIDGKIRDKKNFDMILTKKQRKYQHYRQVEFIKMNILQVKKYYHPIKVGL